MEWWVCVVGTLLCWTIWTLAWRWLRPTKLPPGSRLPPMPPARSLLGHVEFSKPDFYCKKALEWARQYGPVYRIKVNFMDVVLLNDMDSIKKFCKGNELLGRPNVMNLGGHKYKGLSTMNGDVWVANKRFCMASLRDLGFAKCSVESRMMNEIIHLAEQISKAEGQPLALRQDLMHCVTNIIASFFYGTSVASGTRASRELQALWKRMTAALRSTDFFEMWPEIVRRFLAHVPFTCSWKLDAVMQELDEFAIKQINSHVSTADANSDRDFIQSYMKKIEEYKADPEPKFDYKYLVGNVNSFITGGIFGPTGAAHLLLVNVAVRERDIQDRMHREIDQVIGSRRTPTWEDRKQMPFTMACVWEVERWRLRSAFGMPKTSDRDVVVDDFFIPKGTIVLLNLFAVNNDPTFWKDPQRFDPNRYLKEDGSLMAHRPDHHVAFSVGKRSCPGESFALMEGFLIITLLLQRFRVVLDQPSDLDLEDHAIRRGRLDSVKLRFLPRLTKEA